MASSDLSNSKPGVIPVLWALVILFLIVLITWAAAGLWRGSSTYETERVKKRYENLKKLNADNEKKLAEYAWVDKAKGVVQLPIGQAMQITVRELAAKKPVAANPIATPAPIPVETAPAASAAPAAEVAPASTPTVSPTP